MSTGRFILSDLRLRLVLLAACATLPPFGVVLWQIRQHREANLSSARTEARHLTRLACLDFHESLEATGVLLDSLADMPEARLCDGPACSALFKAVCRRQPRYSNIGAVDMEGRYFASALPLPSDPGITARDRSWFKLISAGTSKVVGDYQVGHITGRESVNMAVQVRNEAGTPVAIIFAAIDLTWLERVARTLSLPEGSSLLLVDRNGTVVARHPPLEGWSGKSVPEGPLRDALLSGEERTIEAEGLDGLVRLRACAPIQMDGARAFGLSVAFDPETLLAPTEREQRWALLIFGIVAAGAFIGAWWIGEAVLLRRVDALGEAAERLRRGDLTARTDLPHSPDRLGILASRFDEMAEAIERRTSERNRAETARVESDARFRVFMDHTPAACVLKDEEGRILYANAAVERLLATPMDELRGARTDSLVPPEAAEAIREVERQVLAAGEARQMVQRIPGLDGKVRDWLLLKFPFTEPGGRRLIGTIAIDQTEHTRLESMLLQSQKMESLGSLAAGVAHDFNNLLTAILGHGDLLLKRLPEGDAARRPVTEILKAAHSASGLTRQLLAFSRKSDLKARVIDLNAHLTEAHEILRRVLGEQIELETHLSPTSLRVHVDPVQLTQVVMNLAVNARDAMPSGGKLTIETSPVALDRTYAGSHPEVTPGPYVLLAVTDTGQGMDARIQSRIFEPFFTTKENGKGTGLGLATVHGIVRQAGGHIWVYSEVGKGTTFKVYLPQADSPVSKDEAAAPASSPVARPDATVLLVEDERSVRELAREVLEDAGYRVLEASDGHDAERVAAGHAGAIDLLVTDTIMPGGMGGPQLASRLRADRPALRVIVMSGYAEQAVKRNGYASHQLAFLGKPFSPDDLLRKAREVLESPAEG